MFTSLALNAVWTTSLLLLQGEPDVPLEPEVARPHWEHGLVLHETPRVFDAGERTRCELVGGGMRMTPEGDERAIYVSPVIQVEGGFTEYLPSWNIELQEGATFDFFARIE